MMVESGPICLVRPSAVIITHKTVYTQVYTFLSSEGGGRESVKRYFRKLRCLCSGSSSTALPHHRPCQTSPQIAAALVSAMLVRERNRIGPACVH